MANPYLIQAIYGPKPTPSRVNDNSANDEPSNSERSNREPSTPKLDAGNSRNNHALATSNTSTLSGGSFLKPGDSIPTTSRPMSLAERLYGSTVESNPGIWDRVSPRGSKGDAASDSDNTDNESSVFSKPWAPTGPKKMSVAKSAINCEMSNSNAPSAQSSGILQPAALGSQLRLSAERYLPPRGPHYDQFSLADTFDFAFTVIECSTCWGPKSKCPKANTCTKTCKVCDTRNHPGQTCPLLYCTLSWYKDIRIEPYATWSRGTRSKPFAQQYALQFRPTEKEFSVLSQMGMVLCSFRQGSQIVPNMRHPQVKTFYRKETVHTDAQNKPVGTHSASSTNLDRVTLMRSPNPSSSTSKVGVQPNATLDPRLQGKFAYMTMSKAESPAPSDPVSEIAASSTAAPDMRGYTQIEDLAEARLQELEDEVLKLRMENVQKDREIRRLKSETAKLRGMDDEPGLKRQRA